MTSDRPYFQVVLEVRNFNMNFGEVVGETQFNMYIEYTEKEMGIRK